MIRLKHSLLLVAIFAATLCYSQDEKTYWSKIGFVGAAHLNKMDDFNATLSANGFSPVANEGLYGEFYVKRAKRDSRVLGTFAFTFYDRGAEFTNGGAIDNRADIRGFGLSSGAEYQLIQNKSFFINPGAYLNLDYYRIQFSEGISRPSLDNILNNDNLKTYSASSLQVPILLALNMGVHFPVGETRLGIVGYAGYRFHFDNESWRLNEGVDLMDNINLSGFQVGLGLEVYLTDGELKR